MDDEKALFEKSENERCDDDKPEHEYYIVAENYGIPHEERVEWFKKHMWIIMDILDHMGDEERTRFFYRARPEVVKKYYK